MEAAFLGHQSWHLSHEGTNVLLDPVLGNHFGHSREVDFRVFPPRHIDLQAMPKIDAIFLSHEHLDHFSLPTLNRLPRTIPFYVGILMPGVVTRAIEKLGFKVTRIRHCEPIRIKDLEITLFRGARDQVFWEKRVTQVLAHPVGKPELAIFNGVDASLSVQYEGLVASGQLNPPHSVILANNSQVTPPGAKGAYNNVFPLESERTGGRFAGLRILSGFFNAESPLFENSPNVILCGDGFLPLGEGFGPYLFSDNKRLAALANELNVGKNLAYGPYPGEQYVITEDGLEVRQLPWVKLDEKEMREHLDRQAAFLKNPTPPPMRPLTGKFADDAEAQRAVKLVEAELEAMGPDLIRSPMGIIALDVEQHLSGPLGPRRILFRFLDGPGGKPCQYAFDLAESRFFPDDTPIDQTLERFPFGVEVYLKDFASMLEGRVQIWDLSGNAMRSWFLGGVYENVVSFFLEYYGELARPDLAWKVYTGVLETLKPAGN